MPRVLFRSTFNRVLSVVAWAALAALAAGTLLTPGAFTVAPGIVLGAVAAALIVWAVLWSPSVSVDDEGATVTNVLLEYRVPWAALVHVDTRYALTLHTPGRRISATGAPAPGALGAVRAARAQRRAENTTARGARPGDLPGTDSGGAADLVRSRWEHLRDSGGFEVGVADQTPVGVHARPLPIAAIVLGVAGLVCATLLA
jgi:hypothetical protein